MSVPNELPDIGSTAQRLRQNPRFDPMIAGIGTEEYFVWTRFDGATTLKDLILMTGLSTLRALEIVRKLRTIGAILLPDETPEAVASRLKAAPARPRPDSDAAPTIERAFHRADDEKPTTRVSSGELLTPDEQKALDEVCDLPREERIRILHMHRRVRSGADTFALLGVAAASDKKALKRAYFSLSKDFHPDRFYGKRTGSFAARLDEIFEALSKAYGSVADDRPGRAKTASPLASQNPTDHAAEIFERACQAEVAGDRMGALKLFAAALRLDAPAKYLRRAARCALAAADLTVALEYAKKAANLEPNNPSTARILAQAFKAQGKFGDAEETLVLALMIKTENDQLTHELQADLAEVRRLATR